MIWSIPSSRFFPAILSAIFLLAADMSVGQDKSTDDVVGALSFYSKTVTLSERVSQLTPNARSLILAAGLTAKLESVHVRELLEAADVSQQYFARFPEGFCQNGVSDRDSQHAHLVIKVNATRLNRIPNKGRARIEQKLPPILEQLIGKVPTIDQEVRDLSVSGNKAIVDVNRSTKVRFRNQVLSLPSPVESLVFEKVSGVWLLDSPRELEFAFRLCHPDIGEIVDMTPPSYSVATPSYPVSSYSPTGFQGVVWTTPFQPVSISKIHLPPP